MEEEEKDEEGLRGSEITAFSMSKKRVASLKCVELSFTSDWKDKT